MLIHKPNLTPFSVIQCFIVFVTTTTASSAESIGSMVTQSGWPEETTTTSMLQRRCHRTVPRYCECMPGEKRIRCMSRYRTDPLPARIDQRFSRFSFANFLEVKSFAFQNISYELSASIKIFGPGVVRKDAFHNVRHVDSVELYITDHDFQIESYAFRKMKSRRLEIITKLHNPSFPDWVFADCDVQALVINYNRNENAGVGIMNSGPDFKTTTTIVNTYIVQEAMGITELSNRNFPFFLDTTHIRFQHSLAQRVRANAFSHFVNLTSLDLSLNKISVIEPGAFAGLEAMNVLELSENPLAHIDHASFQGVPNHKKMILYYRSDHSQPQDNTLCVISKIPINVTIDVGENQQECKCITFYISVMRNQEYGGSSSNPCGGKMSEIEMNSIKRTCAIDRTLEGCGGNSNNSTDFYDERIDASIATEEYGDVNVTYFVNTTQRLATTKEYEDVNATYFVDAIPRLPKAQEYEDVNVTYFVNDIPRLTTTKEYEDMDATYFVDAIPRLTINEEYEHVQHVPTTNQHIEEPISEYKNVVSDMLIRVIGTSVDGETVNTVEEIEPVSSDRYKQLNNGHFIYDVNETPILHGYHPFHHGHSGENDLNSEPFYESRNHYSTEKWKYDIPATSGVNRQPVAGEVQPVTLPLRPRSFIHQAVTENDHESILGEFGGFVQGYWPENIPVEYEAITEPKPTATTTEEKPEEKPEVTLKQNNDSTTTYSTPSQVSHPETRMHEGFTEPAHIATTAEQRPTELVPSDIVQVISQTGNLSLLSSGTALKGSKCNCFHSASAVVPHEKYSRNVVQNCNVISYVTYAGLAGSLIGNLGFTFCLLRRRLYAAVMVKADLF